MSEFSPICIYLVISLLVSLIPFGLLFCRNSLIAPYEFTMEKVLFVVRSLKSKLVINLESLLLHGNEDFREQILKREERRRKSNNKAHMARKGNPISVRVILDGINWNCLLRISIVVFLLLLLLTLSYFRSSHPMIIKIKAMLLGRAIRSLFSILGFEIPLLLLVIDCLVSSVVGSSLHMMDPEGASGSSGGSNSISVGGRSEIVGSSRGSGWTEFDLNVLGEPFPNEEGEEVAQPNAQNAPANPVASPGGAQEQEPLPQAPAPAEEALPQAPAPAEVAHPARVSELKRELHTLITERVRQESERGIGPLTTLFPEQRITNSEVARHVMESLEISSENDPENIREWVLRIQEDQNILKDLIGEYLPSKKR